VFATAGSGLHHKICHVLGGAYDLPHAETHAIVLPHATALVTAHLTDVGGRIAGALGAADGTSAATELAELARRLDAPTALREIGLAEDRLPEAVRLVAEQLPDYSVVGLSALLSAAWRGEMPHVRLAPTTVYQLQTTDDG
jgi:maleylacetate reductase